MIDILNLYSAQAPVKAEKETEFIAVGSGANIILEVPIFREPPVLPPDPNVEIPKVNAPKRNPLGSAIPLIKLEDIPKYVEEKLIQYKPEEFNETLKSLDSMSDKDAIRLLLNNFRIEDKMPAVLSRILDMASYVSANNRKLSIVDNLGFLNPYYYFGQRSQEHLYLELPSGESAVPELEKYISEHYLEPETYVTTLVNRAKKLVDHIVDELADLIQNQCFDNYNTAEGIIPYLLKNKDNINEFGNVYLYINPPNVSLSEDERHQVVLMLPDALELLDKLNIPELTDSQLLTLDRRVVNKLRSKK